MRENTDQNNSECGHFSRSVKDTIYGNFPFKLSQKLLSFLRNFIQQILNSDSAEVQGSNPLCSVSKVRDDEDLWQWSRLEIRLNTFHWSTIPWKKFIIIFIFITLSLSLLFSVRTSKWQASSFCLHKKEMMVLVSNLIFFPANFPLVYASKHSLSIFFHWFTKFWLTLFYKNLRNRSKPEELCSPCEWESSELELLLLLYFPFLELALSFNFILLYLIF